jgi:hypothetical protein
VHDQRIPGVFTVAVSMDARCTQYIDITFYLWRDLSLSSIGKDEQNKFGL